MTTPNERSRALVWAGGFLIEIARDKRLPLDIRRRAIAIAPWGIRRVVRVCRGGDHVVDPRRPDERGRHSLGLGVGLACSHGSASVTMPATP
jgi:hypothetical protein